MLINHSEFADVDPDKLPIGTPEPESPKINCDFSPIIAHYRSFPETLAKHLPALKERAKKRGKKWPVGIQRNVTQMLKAIDETENKTDCDLFEICKLADRLNEYSLKIEGYAYVGDNAWVSNWIKELPEYNEWFYGNLSPKIQHTESWKKLSAESERIQGIKNETEHTKAFELYLQDFFQNSGNLNKVELDTLLRLSSIQWHNIWADYYRKKNENPDEETMLKIKDCVIRKQSLEKTGSLASNKTALVLAIHNTSSWDWGDCAQLRFYAWKDLLKSGRLDDVFPTYYST